MIDSLSVKDTDTLQMVNLFLSIFPKIASSLKARFGKRKGEQIVSCIIQELLKLNPDRPLVNELLSEAEAPKMPKPIKGLARAKFMKSRVEEHQKKKASGVLITTKKIKAAKKTTSGKTKSWKVEILPGISVGHSKPIKDIGRGIISLKSKSKPRRISAK